MWVPTCGLTCVKACPATPCKSFVTCNRGTRSEAPRVPVQLSMEDEEKETRRCRLASSSIYSASMPRLRAAALPAVSAGADFWAKWISGALDSETDVEGEESQMIAHEVDVPSQAQTAAAEKKEEPSSPVVRSAKTSKGSGSTRRLSAPPPRTKRSSLGRARSHRASYPRSHRASSQHKLRKAEADETACSPQTYQGTSSDILDPALAAVLPACGVQLEQDDLPRPPIGDSWDWPLTRHEKKARILLIDKNVIQMDRQFLQDELSILRSLETPWC